MFQPREIFWEKIREKLKQLKINNSIPQVSYWYLYKKKQTKKDFHCRNKAICLQYQTYVLLSRYYTL